MRSVSGFNLRRRWVVLVAVLGAAAAFATSPAVASAASCDVVDARANFTSPFQYAVSGHAVGCRPAGTDYGWRLTVTSEGNLVWTTTGQRYNPGSSWSTSTYYRPGSDTAVYCATFRVRNLAPGNIVGSGTDCT